MSKRPGEVYSVRSGTRRVGSCKTINEVLEAEQPKTVREARKLCLRRDPELSVKSIQGEYYKWKNIQDALKKGRATNSADSSVKAKVSNSVTITKLPDQTNDFAEVKPELIDPSGAFIRCPELVGIDESVYRQIGAALRAGKQHLMFYGPPGTGKTTLAQWVAENLHSQGTYKMITGSADWTSQDVIGGYQPVGPGKIQFIPGVLLQNFDRPLIIDELNRCDIDKVIGPLFTILSGQKTTLPYRTEISDASSAAYEILPKPKSYKAEHEYAPGRYWRIIATINSMDKAALYQMSFALTRRFGWIYVDVPSDLQRFMAEVMRKRDISHTRRGPLDAVLLADIWQAVNRVRVIGSAPILDMLETIHAAGKNMNFSDAPEDKQASVYLDGFCMYILPMLDGIQSNQAKELAGRICELLKLPIDSKEAQELKRMFDSLAV